MLTSATLEMPNVPITQGVKIPEDHTDVYVREDMMSRMWMENWSAQVSRTINVHNLV